MSFNLLRLCSSYKYTSRRAYTKFYICSDKTAACFQIYCRPTYAHFEEWLLTDKPIYKKRFSSSILRLAFTSTYMVLVTLVAAAMPFFGDFVSICGAIGFTPLDFVLPALAFLKSGKTQRSQRVHLLVKVVNLALATWFSIVAVLGCVGAVRSIVLDVKTYKFFHDM